MAQVRETRLPGVGVRHEFTTNDHDTVGVLVHHDGRREILVYDGADPDACSTVLKLSVDDTRTLNELLGGSTVSEEVSAAVRQDVEGLAIEWIDVPEGARAAGVGIGEAGYRSKTGASVVAIIRDGGSVPAPGPEFVIQVGDVVVAVGTSDNLVQLRDLLRS